MKHLAWIAFLVSLPVFGQDATVFNQSNVLFISENAEMHVFGDIITDGPVSILENEGFIQTYDDVTPGNFELQNEGIVISSGDYRIENDWTNNGLLMISEGMVEMYGDNQWFYGDSISSFWNLQLTGLDRKEQAQDIRVRSILDLTDRELAVHAQIVYVDSSDVNAIIFDQTFNAEGIISTDEDGFIKKYILQGDLNLIPTGSSEGSFRHRPIKVLMTSSDASDTAIVTFHHHTPDLVGAFEADTDTSLCKIQNKYFYTFTSANPTNRYQLDFAHYPPTDGYYPDVAQWNTPTWRVVYDHGNYTDPNYSYVSAFNESDFIDEHYTLAYKTPDAPYMLYDSTECYELANYQIEMPLGQPWYEWTVTNDDGTAFVTTGQGTDFATVDWAGDIGGWIYNQYTDTAGCWSHMDSAQIFDVSITADFYFTNDFSQGTSTNFTFVNQSSQNTDEAIWFMDNNQDYLYDPDVFLPYFYNFETNGEETTYEVILIANNFEHGCTDTAIQVIRVPSIFVFYAPTSFTPDGDGYNEFFFGHATDIKWIEMQIFNRWGELIFSGEDNNSASVVWDGTYRGQPVQTGTYVYKFIIWPNNYDSGEKSAFEYTGHVSVLK
ncbi:MAG: gliding motility-associated C-terminal domain-containing protein [Crocinitomicaceae bacterium]|nr:gliding motility-associated C-terminal domain-containing protein [Flavobacteriales bacterium]NQZ35874.1 gliding motility-associated C-terminal domain-containing protein [Crocinitomicaceae bacterium]